jgi:hypothetical protein
LPEIHNEQHENPNNSETETNSLELWLNNYLKKLKIDNQIFDLNEWVKKRCPNEDLSKIDKKRFEVIKGNIRRKIKKIIETDEQKKQRLLTERKNERKRRENEDNDKREKRLLRLREAYKKRQAQVIKEYKN